jgi:hypothetical protein
MRIPGPATLRLWTERTLDGITQAVLTILDIFSR